MNSLKHIIHFDKRKGIIGAMLSVLALTACGIWFSWGAGAVFAVLFLIVGFVKIEVEKNWQKYLLNFLWGLAVTAVTWYVSIEMVDAFTYFTFYPDKQSLNILCILILYAAAFLVTANWRISVVAVSLFLVAVSTANGFVYQFRGKELGPMDIRSFSTAMNMADQYHAEITSGVAYGWIKWILVFFLQFSLPKLPSFSRIRVRIDAFIIEIIFILTLCIGAQNIPIKTWDKQGTEINGYFLNFYLGMRDSSAEKPEKYDPEAVETFAQQYIVTDKHGEKANLPNIVVVMNESFADFRVLGDELRTNQPVTPFMDSLEKNTIRGHTLVSVFGGNTANSEFEFLTGHSLSLLPNNSIPYQQYINGNICTLAWVLDSYGYKSIATHPYFANGWSRNRIYPYLGFEESTFMDSYPAENKIRGYISDQEMFEQIMLKLNENEDPLFLFGITVQNHGSYTYSGENYTQTIELEGYKKEYPQAEQYLSLIHETDKAVEYLLTALEDYPEDTVVLFFGDHFPQVEGELFAEIHNGYFSELPDKMLQHTVPFFIWANYDIPEQTIERTSLNYLSRHLLDTAGLELSPYYQFMADLEEAVPAMNAFGFYSVSRDEFITYDEANEEENSWLNQYANLQYNNLFNAKKRSKLFFEQYMTSEENDEQNIDRSVEQENK